MPPGTGFATLSNRSFPDGRLAEAIPSNDRKGGEFLVNLLEWALVFFGLALVAAVLGLADVPPTSFGVFLVAATCVVVIVLALGGGSRDPNPRG